MFLDEMYDFSEEPIRCKVEVNDKIVEQVIHFKRNQTTNQQIRCSVWKPKGGFFEH